MTMARATTTSTSVKPSPGSATQLTETRPVSPSTVRVKILLDPVRVSRTDPGQAVPRPLKVTPVEGPEASDTGEAKRTSAESDTTDR